MEKELADEIDWEQLARYFKGDCTPHEAAEFERWISAAPERRQFVARMRVVWDKSALIREPWDVEAALRRMDPKLRNRARVVPIRPDIFLQHGAPGRRWTSIVGRAAAVLLLGVGIAAASRTGVFHRFSAPPAPVAMQEVATRRGQLATVQLVDGTQVTLGPDSKLRYAANFGSAARDVHLEGTAFFVVRHDARKPFIVRAGGAVAEDLGTEFTVRAYPGDTHVQVVVADGEVELRADTASSRGAVLARGQMGRIDRRGVTSVQRVSDVRPYIAWTEGRLSYVNAPLPDVLADLSRWYEVEFSIGDHSLEARHLTTSFEKESLAQVVAILEASLEARAVRTGSTVTLRSRGSSPRQ